MFARMSNRASPLKYFLIKMPTSRSTAGSSKSLSFTCAFFYNILTVPFLLSLLELFPSIFSDILSLVLNCLSSFLRPINGVNRIKNMIKYVHISVIQYTSEY